MKNHHITSVLLCFCLFLTACASNSFYQTPASETDHATLKVSLVDGGFLSPDKPIVRLRSINGLPIEDWGGGIFGSILGSSFDIPAGPVFAEVKPPVSYGGYVRFNAKKGETYMISYQISPQHRFTLTVKDSAGNKVFSHDFLQDFLCSYSNADTRLIDAIAFEDIGEIKELLDGDVDPNQFKCEEWHPLPLAAKLNNIEIIRILIVSGAQVDGFDGVAALQYALKHNNLEMMKLLVANGADINLRSGRLNILANSLLMDASEQGNIRFVKFLLAHGAYTEFRDRNKKTAIRLAKEAGYEEIVDLFNNHAD